MAKILIKNIHTLYQAGEDFPEMISGDASAVAKKIVAVLAERGLLGAQA